MIDKENVFFISLLFTIPQLRCCIMEQRPSLYALLALACRSPPKSRNSNRGILIAAMRHRLKAKVKHKNGLLF